MGTRSPVGTGTQLGVDGGFVGELIATITEFAAQTSPFEVLAASAGAFLFIAIVSLGVEYLRLKKRYDKAEAELFERTVGRQSTNWTNTAQNLERKAKDPGLVAQSSAMTHLHMLDEAANAWLKGSQWQEALRVTQEFLRECCHAIGRPSIHEDDFRAAADLIERRLATYPDLSKAGNEAIENAVRFLSALDTSLSVFAQNPRIAELREHVAAARTEVEAKPDGKSKSGRAAKPVSISNTPGTPSSPACSPAGSE